MTAIGSFWWRAQANGLVGPVGGESGQQAVAITQDSDHGVEDVDGVAETLQPAFVCPAC